MEEEKVLTEKSEPASVGKPVYAQFVLPMAILAAALIISGALIYTRGNTGTAQIGAGGDLGEPVGAPVDIEVNASDHVLGNKDAKVTLVEFSDFQCPFCRSFWRDTLPQLKKDYIDSGKVKFVYRHFPLGFHAVAQISAEATECAGDQDKFWQLHDKIFEEQNKLGQGTIEYGKKDIQKWAGAVGLNMNQFNQCLDSGKYSQRVKDDLNYGGTVGVSGTPTLFVNGQRIVGAQPYANFKAIIDSLLK